MVLGGAEVNVEELQTIFVGVESLLNSRPLTSLSDDSNDEPVLTINQFLIGQLRGGFVPESVDTTPFSPRKTRLATVDVTVSATYWMETKVVLSCR